MKYANLIAAGWATVWHLAALTSQAADVAPAAIAGTWDVIAIQVDREDSMHALYQEGDPRLVGRSLSIEAGKVVFSYGKDIECLLRNDPQFLLLLARRPPAAKPTVASFDCPSAKKPSEKTICRDYDLASWDRSVSRALQQYLQARPEKRRDAHTSASWNVSGAA